VNRLAGEVSFCRTAAPVLVAHAGLHHGEEPPLSGSRGSGTIFFAGCNLRCVYCQNWQISQRFSPDTVQEMTPEELAGEMLRLQALGAHNINLVTPSHVLWQAVDAIVMARDRGLSIPVVYNSGGYDSVEALREIRGLIDIYMPDIKYMETEPARRYSGAADYPEIVPGVLQEMFEQTGPLKTDEAGIAVRGLLVRHLVLPGLTANSRKCLETVAGISTEIPVSLMSQYSPQHKAARFPEINRTLHTREYLDLVDYALSLGLETLFTQDISSREEYLPDFDREKPFE
jgi:putative pyruvate formate lyase activating enzyme